MSNPVRLPPFSTFLFTSGLASESTTGKGANLYMIETVAIASFFGVAEQSAIALLQIAPDTCPVEVASSPFALPAGAPTTLSAYPPRPF